MTAIVMGALILGVLCYIADEGFLAKLAVAALVAAIAFLLLGWITDWELMTTLAKLSAATTILSTLVNIIRKIVD